MPKTHIPNKNDLISTINSLTHSFHLCGILGRTGVIGLPQLEGFFMHNDSWGQYDGGDDQTEQLNEFIEGFQLVLFRKKVKNKGDPHFIWASGTIFYLNNNARNQCAINHGHHNDILPANTQVILPPETEIRWGNRLVKISSNETVENRTVNLVKGFY